MSCENGAAQCGGGAYLRLVWMSTHTQETQLPGRSTRATSWGTDPIKIRLDEACWVQM